MGMPEEMPEGDGRREGDAGKEGVPSSGGGVGTFGIEKDGNREDPVTRDLSFNRLTGEIPKSFERLVKKEFMHEAVPCLIDSRCPSAKNYHLHINCGGEEVSVNGTTYVNDQDLGSPAKYFASGDNWAFSSTGDSMDNDNTDNYIATNQFMLSMPDAKYMQAGIAPISLIYFGFCLVNGNYRVKLHFAEITITDENSFRSLRQRIFDVYIQGQIVMKDFNIRYEAQGSNKAIIKNFYALVKNNTLEIRLYWVGKGTVSLPYWGTYGPLISAISIESAKRLQRVSKKLMSHLAIFFELRDLDLQTGSFTLRQMKAATDNFSTENKIGEGGFGPVYKGNHEFLNEISMISALQHPNLVKLYGSCTEGNHLLLVYEYMENNSLARALFGPNEDQWNLDWLTRSKICVGIARGLAYLHGETRLKIVHRDIKPTNILLDKDLNPKISDFGLAKLDEEENTHIKTRIAGTM
ncbi:putative LRR receptor-like serine/threonine-protein kinase [Acorus gramineus]|uniref:non-specific serine/threonine protein kinase n=1 Tax=Acorus gramineus TaxID=55184 RepID=A0AAV9BI98_ACOGR|nr:putative LRR receptor-like serine/threonine-protein kinase [Acorus gramineus]